MTTTQIPGYDYGSQQLARSPISLNDFGLLQQSVLFSEEDARYLKMAGQVLEPHVESILDLWYGFVGSHPHLVQYFSGQDGQPNAAYLDAVRKRFGQWIRDTCRAEYDQKWLDYQHEIALRHTEAKKNRTDKVSSKASLVPLRYMIAFVYPITATIRPFLEKGKHSPEEVEKMHQAWFKSVVLQVTLWAQPYAKDGTF